MSSLAKINNPKIYTLGVKKFVGAIHFPMIQTTFLPQNIGYEKYEVVIFTSQIAITHALQDKNKWKDKVVLCVGDPSRELLLSEGITRVFTPKINNASSLINEHLSLLKNQKTLYLRGEKIATNLKTLLSSQNITIDEVITYQTHCKEISTAQPDIGSYVILSSPFIVQCFAQKYNLNDYKLIAIGKKTASFIPKSTPFSLSQTTNIDQIIQKLQKN